MRCGQQHPAPVSPSRRRGHGRTPHPFLAENAGEDGLERGGGPRPQPARHHPAATGAEDRGTGRRGGARECPLGSERCRGRAGGAGRPGLRRPGPTHPGRAVEEHGAPLVSSAPGRRGAPWVAWTRGFRLGAWCSQRRRSPSTAPGPAMPWDGLLGAGGGGPVVGRHAQVGGLAGFDRLGGRAHISPPPHCPGGARAGGREPG